jgi:hypothetical protein
MNHDRSTPHSGIDGLTPDDLEALAWLGILCEDSIIFPATAATLWAQPEAEARQRLHRLQDTALVQSTDDEGFRLDTATQEAAKQLLSERMPWPEAHAQLLQHYRAQAQDGLWHTLPDDGYIHEHLTWHMEQAGWDDQIHALLREETPEGRNGWFEAREALHQTAGYLADVARAWRLTEGESNVGLACRYALVIASINSRADSIEPVLLLALVEAQIWTPAQGLAYARRSTRRSQHAEKVASLLPHLSESLRGSALHEALAAARPVQGGWYPSEALGYMLPYLPGPQRTEMIEEAMTELWPLHDAGWKIWWLRWLIPHLPEPRRAQVVDELLAWLEEMDDEQYRADLVVHFALHVPDPLRGQVLAERLVHGLAAQDEGDRAETLAPLIPYLQEPERSRALEEALASVEAIQRRDVRFETLVTLARQLPEPRKRVVLTAALAQELQIRDVGYRGWMMAHLALELPVSEQPVMLAEALATIGRDRSPWSRAQSLADLVPRLPQDLRPKALSDALLALQDFPVGSGFELEQLLASLTCHLDALPSESLLEYAFALANRCDDDAQLQVSVLTSFAPCLTGPLREQVLAEALRVVPQSWPEERQSDALGRLAPYLPPELLKEAFLLTRQMQSSWARAAALAGLAPYLPTALQQEALAMAQKLMEEDARARALAGLAPHLSDPQKGQMLGEALSLVRQVENDTRRAHLLDLLARDAPDALLEETVTEARAIQNDYARAEALAGLVSYLPEPLKAQTLKRTLETVRRLETSYQAVYLVPLVPYMSEAQKEEVLAAALEWHDIQLLTHLIPHLAGSLQERAVIEALPLALNVGLEDKRARIFEDLAPDLAELPAPQLEPLWHRTLFVLASGTRWNLLSDLKALAPVIASLGGPEAATEVYRAIQDVGRWWP